MTNYEKTSELTNIKFDVILPNVDCNEENKKKMLLRVAEHCPVRETIVNTNAINFNVNGKMAEAV